MVPRDSGGVTIGKIIFTLMFIEILTNMTQVSDVAHGPLVFLFVCCFTFRSRLFHLYGDDTIAGEGLQNLGLCSVLRAFEQGGIFIVTHLLRHGTSVFPVSSEGPPHLVAFYDTLGGAEDLF